MNDAFVDRMSPLCIQLDELKRSYFAGTPITGVAYSCLDADYHFILLASDVNFLRYYMDHSHYNTHMLDRPFESFASGFYIPSELYRTNEIVAFDETLKYSFDYHQRCVLMRKHADCCEFFSFVADAKFASAFTYYANHIEILEAFCDRVVNEVVSLRSQANASPIVLPQPAIVTASHAAFDQLQGNALQFELNKLRQIKLLKQLAKAHKCDLSHHEKEALALMLLNKKSREIAEYLAMSHDNVHTILRNTQLPVKHFQDKFLHCLESEGKFQ